MNIDQLTWLRDQLADQFGQAELKFDHGIGVIKVKEARNHIDLIWIFLHRSDEEGWYIARFDHKIDEHLDKLVEEITSADEA